MQWQVQREPSECDADFPPGFETAIKAGQSNFFDDILEIVLTDLHLSSKMSLVKYIESLLAEQVRKVVDSRDDVEFTEVISKLLLDFGCYELLMLFSPTLASTNCPSLPLKQRKKSKG